MLYYPFKNYEEFKELFGMIEHDNGEKSRKNKILLTFWKSRKMIQFIGECGPMFDQYLNIVSTMKQLRSMGALKQWCLRNFSDYARCHGVDMAIGRGDDQSIWYSSEYATDSFYGYTEDNDQLSIRYVRKDNGHVFKMKAGKLFRKLILETALGKVLPEQVINWLLEELVRNWAGANDTSRYALCVSGDEEDFEAIYDSNQCYGNFGSCMTDNEQWRFYCDAVHAHAAYLLDKETDKIVARAIIFNDVHDMKTGEVIRLCERQYATDGNTYLMQILVNKLIEAGKIDGYKRIGASCHDGQNFVANDGTDLTDHPFYIRCYLGYGDTLSYQDSFKYYDIKEHTAYNMYSSCPNSYSDLATTDSEFEGGQWDDYHEEYVNETREVYYNGQWIQCDVDRLDDFYEIDGEYIHESHVDECEHCGTAFRDADGYYSLLTDDDYCCSHCRVCADEDYIADNFDTITSQDELDYVYNNYYSLYREYELYLVDGDEARQREFAKEIEAHELANQEQA